MAIYRFIYAYANGFETGANYPLCSLDNTPACIPQHFGTIEAAVDYAYAHNELPYMVFTDHEAWDIIAGTVQIDPTRILPPVAVQEVPWLWIAAGIAVLLLVSRKGGST